MLYYRLIKAIWSWYWSAAASKPTREGHRMARVRLISWEGGSNAVLFMVQLGPSGAGSMAQELQLLFEYNIIYNNATFHT